MRCRAFLPIRLTAALLIATGAICLSLFLTTNYSSAQNAVRAGSREITVGLKDTPPFVFKTEDGDWQGISVDLWRQVASGLHLPYRLVEEPTIDGLIQATANGKYDVAVGALTVTASRARMLDFTSSFFSTGLGIAVPASGTLNWVPVLRAFLNVGFLQSVLALLALALMFGFLIWSLERKDNEQFGGDFKKGLSSSIWWATAAMTRRGNADYNPRTVSGRVVASVWTVTSIVAIAIFTAAVTSTLTVRHLQGVVHGVSDLKTVRVGAVKGSSTHDALADLKIKALEYDGPREGLLALRAQKIDAFVYDKPLLGWLIQREFSSSIELLDTTFQPQNYAFAIPDNSPMRGPLNVALLEATQSAWWRETLARYLGSGMN